jgi:hypothetical protein
MDRDRPVQVRVPVQVQVRVRDRADLPGCERRDREIGVRIIRV